MMDRRQQRDLSAIHAKTDKFIGNVFLFVSGFSLALMIGILMEMGL